MLPNIVFNKEDWHSCTSEDYADCIHAMNCYSYALNNKEFYWSVPGHGFAHTKTQHYYDSYNKLFQNMPSDKFVEAIKKGAVKDGLIPVSEIESRQDYYCVALFFPENDNDFHWYRQDTGGLWSHKNGWLEATDADDVGSLIVDPRKAARHEYTIFGGLYLVPVTGIVLEQDFPLL